MCGSGQSRFRFWGIVFAYFLSINIDLCVCARALRDKHTVSSLRFTGAYVACRLLCACMREVHVHVSVRVFVSTTFKWWFVKC